MADGDVVACVQPNFLKWAGPDGLYDSRIGDRRLATTRLRTLLDAGVTVAFGSDGMPMDPLVGVAHAVTAPDEQQRVGVTEALRAYTLGGARAGCEEDTTGTVTAGKRADLAVLDRSPWGHPDAVDDVEVTLTVARGDVVYDARGEESGPTLRNA
jgi:predicted amidohydrolase YtcJ